MVGATSWRGPRPLVWSTNVLWRAQVWSPKGVQGGSNEVPECYGGHNEGTLKKVHGNSEGAPSAMVGTVEAFTEGLGAQVLWKAHEG